MICFAKMIRLMPHLLQLDQGFNDWWKRTTFSILGPRARIARGQKPDFSFVMQHSNKLSHINLIMYAIVFGIMGPKNHALELTAWRSQCNTFPPRTSICLCPLHSGHESGGRTRAWSSLRQIELCLQENHSRFVEHRIRARPIQSRRIDPCESNDTIPNTDQICKRSERLLPANLKFLVSIAFLTKSSSYYVPLASQSFAYSCAPG